MTELDVLAAELGVSGRTLRRAAARSVFRLERPSPQRAILEADERRYLRDNWPLLQGLLGSLRTERNVRLAVLFGSVARGEDHPRSDVDLLVRLARPERLARFRLALRLSEELERHVQIVSLDDAKRAPLLLADVIRDGRVLVDRDGDWAELLRREGTIRREARRAADELENAAWSTLDALAG